MTTAYQTCQPVTSRSYCLAADINLVTPMHVESTRLGWHDPATSRISAIYVQGAQRCALTTSGELGGPISNSEAMNFPVPVIPADLIASRLLRIAERESHLCCRGTGMCTPISLHPNCLGFPESMHGSFDARGAGESHQASLQSRLHEVDPMALLTVETAYPVLKAMRGTMDPEPQVNAMPFRTMDDMTMGMPVRPMRHVDGRLVGRIEPTDSDTIEYAAHHMNDRMDVLSDGSSYSIGALEVVRPGVSFHIRIQLQTQLPDSVQTVSRWLQCLMREAQIGTCGMSSSKWGSGGLGRFECKASGLYSINAQTGRASLLTRLFCGRQSGYMFCKHPLMT